jgi:mannose-6-phosphate isomerase-like protein (cupin superfamily)
MNETQHQTAPIVHSTDEWVAEVNRLAQKKVPSFFHVRCQLPAAGRTNQVLGATDLMNIVLKTYAEGGENELHAHPNEDHAFLIMQGNAEFYGPNDEKRVIGPNDIVLLPRNSLYWFKASGKDPLVMLRIGAAERGEQDLLARNGANHLPLDGFSAENKEVPLVLKNEWFE